MYMSKQLCTFFLVALCLPGASQLPSLQDKKWLGHFAAHERRDFQFSVLQDGTMKIEVINDKGVAMGTVKTILITPSVCEVVGPRSIVKKIDEKSLVSPDKPNLKAEKISYRGKVTEGAEFEMNVAFDGDKVKLGGRILNPGALKKPLEFQVRTKIQNVYMYTDKEKLKDETDRDRIEFIRDDKQRGRIGSYKAAKFSDEKVFGKGLTNVEVDMKPFAGKRFKFDLEGPGLMRMENPRGISSCPMEGFFVLWRYDAEKDPEAKGRVIIEVK